VLLGRYLQEHCISNVRFDSIIATAEVLLPGQREFLEGTFHARVFNRYGCREVSVIASECDQHRGMHVNAEALFVEVAPDPSVPPPAGKILVTDLLNYSMPLIRYEIGDVGRWAENQDCPCGRGLPLLADVQGRITDFLVLPDGRRVSGPALTLVVSDMSDVRQVQFVQRSPYLVVLRVVPGRNYGPHTARELRRRLSVYLGDSVSLELEEVASVASEASGKYRFVINDAEDRHTDDSLRFGHEMERSHAAG
jgi:phenylacetate-CoA ligase